MEQPSLCTTTPEACVPRTHAPQERHSREKPAYQEQPPPATARESRRAALEARPRASPTPHSQLGEESCCARCCVTVTLAWLSELHSRSLPIVVCFLPPLHSQLFEIREAWLLSGFLGVRNVGNVQIIPPSPTIFFPCRLLDLSSLTVKALNPNHWTVREFPHYSFP